MQVRSEIKGAQELSDWRQFLSRSTLWLGIWLIGSAVICAVAANWESLSTVQRFVGAQGLLALCVLIAAWLGWRWRAEGSPQRRYGPQALLALAGLLLGALLALLGQTYQTGADTWELFTFWGILLLPWALVAMSQAVWLLWMIVLNIAAILYTQEGSVFFAGLETSEQMLPVTMLNVLFLAGWEYAARRWHASTMIGPRVLLAWLLTIQVGTLCFSYAPYYGLGSSMALFWLATTVSLGIYYQRVRLDLVALAMLAAGVMVMSLRILGELGFDLFSNELIILLLAGLLVAETVWLVGWLRRLASGSAGDDDTEAPAEPVNQGHQKHGQPWYVQGLLALSAWLTTVLVLFFVLATSLVQSAEGAITLGIVFCMAAMVGLRASTALFGRQCLTALGFAGQLLVLGGLVVQSDFSELTNGTWLYVFVLSTVVYALGAETLLRFLSACLMAFALAALIVQWLVPGVMQVEVMFAWLEGEAYSAVLVWLPIAVLGAWIAALAFYLGYRSRVPSGDGVGDTSVQGGDIEAARPLAWAFALAVQAMVWLAGGLSLGQISGVWKTAPLLALTNVAGVLLPAICAMVLLWPRRQILTSGLVWGVPLGLVVLAVFWLPSPGIAFALTWMLLGFGLRDSRLMVVGAISLLAYLIVYYYQLQVPLIDKAIWLGGAALLLFVLRALVYFVPRWMRTIEIPPVKALAPATAILKWRTTVILGGLLLVLGVVNYAIWQRETLLTQGRTVILELAPVDPRSLMQGDYMALRFAASDDLRRPFGHRLSDVPADGYVVLQPDGKGVAQWVRTQADVQPLSGDEIALRYRVRGNVVRIVTNAYFFPEGQASHFEQARYGEVRVGKDGTGLLVRMLGADKQPL
jgi:uncharacterized membrane-anchored protein/uncharacterized membrane protein